MDPVYATIDAGTVEYNREDAAIEIEDVIRQLRELQEEGATHLVGLSGNYRGAMYVNLRNIELAFDAED